MNAPYCETHEMFWTRDEALIWHCKGCRQAERRSAERWPSNRPRTSHRFPKRNSMRDDPAYDDVAKGRAEYAKEWKR